MKWAQTVINWKKVNVNKVSEYFDTCRQLCMLTLEEVKRLAVDLFIIDNDKEIEEILRCNNNATTDSGGSKMSRLYIAYIHTMNTRDYRRLYMMGFIMKSTQFCNYWKATRLGDRITMEHIQNKWIGVHLMSGKHTFIENYLNAIDLEYKAIDNIALQEIRMNISVCYHAYKDKSGYGSNYIHLTTSKRISINGRNMSYWDPRKLLGEPIVLMLQQHICALISKKLNLLRTN